MDWNLPEPERRGLLSLAQVVPFLPADIVIHEGEEGGWIGYILEGAADVVSVIEENEICLNRLGAGDFFGEGSFTNTKIRSASVIATAPLTILKWHCSQFIPVAQRNPGLLMIIIRQLMARIGQMNQQFVRTRTRTARMRVLEEMQTAISEGNLRIGVGEIARRAGVARETASRIIATFRENYDES